MGTNGKFSKIDTIERERQGNFNFQVTTGIKALNSLFTKKP